MDALLGELREFMKRPVAEHSAEASLYLSWDQIDEMRRHNIEFGNHSRTHPNMQLLTEEEQLAEIRGVQMDLEKRLPSVRAFAHRTFYSNAGDKLGTGECSRRRRPQ